MYSFFCCFLYTRSRRSAKNTVLTNRNSKMFNFRKRYSLMKQQFSVQYSTMGILLQCHGINQQQKILCTECLTFVQRNTYSPDKLCQVLDCNNKNCQRTILTTTKEPVVVPITPFSSYLTSSKIHWIFVFKKIAILFFLSERLRHRSYHIRGTSLCPKG